jgi:hypothetical protein
LRELHLKEFGLHVEGPVRENGDDAAPDIGQVLGYDFMGVGGLELPRGGLDYSDGMRVARILEGMKMGPERDVWMSYSTGCVLVENLSGE